MDVQSFSAMIHSDHSTKNGMPDQFLRRDSSGIQMNDRRQPNDSAEEIHSDSKAR
jgi:hypothetical protein